MEHLTRPLIRYARFETPQAARHMRVLCQHFGRKTQVSVAGQSSRVQFSFGWCQMTAQADHLDLRVFANERAGLDLGVQVMSRHLERFAFRENPILDWQPLRIDHATSTRSPIPS